ncbi:MAG: redoxin domain-containing protein [Planctomycetota bacterium]
MPSRPRYLPFVLTLALGVFTVGCNSDSTDTSTSEAEEWAAPAEASAPELSEEELAAMAKDLGMTVEELQAKKQMMRDSGMWPDEIAKALAMGGSPEALFKDDVATNVEPPDNLGDLVFFRTDKEAELELKNLIGKSNIVLVFTRGYYGGSVCPFCVTQTAELTANKPAFEERDAVVLIVYPGSSEHVADFAAAVTQTDREKADIAAVGWPVVLDQNLEAVHYLNIAADLASPSTFIIDKEGNVAFAYVGATRTDRPSVKAVLEQLDALQPQADRS